MKGQRGNLAALLRLETGVMDKSRYKEDEEFMQALQPQPPTIRKMLSLTSSVKQRKGFFGRIKKDMKGKESCEVVESTASHVRLPVIGSNHRRTRNVGCIGSSFLFRRKLLT
jgi:hypothetical protein